MSQDNDILHEAVIVPGPQGRLEGRLAYPAAGDPCGSVLIAGPHPLLGGDMQNNVVRSLADGLAAVRLATLRFNYSGIGQSQGGPPDWPLAVSRFWKDSRFEDENAWLSDTACAAAALRQWCDAPQILLGYSFGCWAAIRAAIECQPNGIALISPNPKQHDFGLLANTDAPLFVLHSSNDFSCREDELIDWFMTLREPKARLRMDAGEHFFRGKEHEVVQSVVRFLETIHLAEAISV